MRARLTATWTGLFVAFVGPPALAAWSLIAFGTAPSLPIEIALQLVMCAMALVVLIVVRRGERLPLSSVGLRRPDALTAVLAVGIVLVSYYLLPMLTAWLMPVVESAGGGGSFESGVAVLASRPRWWRVCIAVSSGPVEELLYRGYAVERLGMFTGRPAVGGSLAALAFGLAHVPFWGLGPALAADLPFGILMVAAYMWRRDLVANAVAHTGLLLVSLLSL